MVRRFHYGGLHMKATALQTAAAEVAASSQPGAAPVSRGFTDTATVAIAAAVLGGQLYRRPTVRAVTGLSDSTLDRMIKAGTFPAPVKLGPRTSAWRSSDVAAWMASLSAVE